MKEPLKADPLCENLYHLAKVGKRTIFDRALSLEAKRCYIDLNMDHKLWLSCSTLTFHMHIMLLQMQLYNCSDVP